MNNEEFKEFEKQVYENEDTAIKLLERNVELNKKLEELEETIDNQANQIEKLKTKIEELQNTEQFNPYSEYGISERDFS